MMFKGAIIKETLTDELLLDFLNIDKVEIWKTNDTIKYWTMIWFTSEIPDLPERLSNVLIDGWFADMKADNIKYIIFKDAVLKYTIGNAVEKEAGLNECRKHGIPDELFAWEE
jgi:hypothetical protein